MKGESSRVADTDQSDPAAVDAPADKPIPGPPRPKDTPRRCASCGSRTSGKATRPPSSKTSCARAFAWNACRIRRSWCCSGRPATSPTARSSRRSTSCGGRTCCRTSSLLLAIGRRPYDNDAFRAEIRDVARAVQPRAAARRAGMALVHRADRLRPARLRRPGRRSKRSRQRSTSSTRSAAPAAIACSTSPPSRRNSPTIVAQLGRVGLDHELHDGGWRRVVIEKPFGHDLDFGTRSSTARSARSSASRRSTASTITWARRPSAT